MADKAVIDLRIYTIRPRAVQQYLKLYKKWALPVVTKHWGPPLGFFVTEVGPLNQVIHMWAFESLADFERCRASLLADPEFAKYFAATEGFIIAQEDRIVRRVDFESMPS
jgi:hypothetical protein